MEKIVYLDAYRAAQRCWEARAGQDEKTREALGRAARRYIQRALGMGA